MSFLTPVLEIRRNYRPKRHLINTISQITLLLTNVFVIKLILKNRCCLGLQNIQLVILQTYLMHFSLKYLFLFKTFVRTYLDLMRFCYATRRLFIIL